MSADVAVKNGMTKSYTRAMNTLGAALLLALSLPVAQAHDLILDNSDPRFSTYGTWPASTAVTGYQGNNYQTHEANGAAPGALVIDNTDSGFSVTGTWPLSTAVSGHLGSNYQTHSANGEEPGAIVIDNPQGQASGLWGISTSVTGYYGSHYQTHAAGDGSNSFNWNTPITAGTYDVYARWTAHPNRASNAQYTVTDSTGSHVVTVNQQANGGSWQLLGSYTFDTGASITLTDQANGYVIADAIQFAPADQPQNNTATWTPNVIGGYQVYAKWTQHPNRASNAQYTITDSTGTHPVSVDQQQNGGIWNLLGTFDLNAASTILLTDQANGYVIADAIKLVATNVPPTVSLISSANNATANAPGSFTLTATATSTTSTIAKVDFYANNGTTNTLVGTAATAATAGAYSFTWSNVALGSYSITAVATDTLNAVTTSSTVTVTVNTGIAQAYYIHTDHLDSPREITDTAGNVVWQWENSDPFGNNIPNENPNGAGQFSFNLRFPGQYFDKETGLHQNYFRDYDPALGGRYIESDPIGLAGGINTFAYAEGNPISNFDPDGLVVRVVTSDPQKAKILMEAYARLNRTKRGQEITRQLECSKDVYKIKPIDKNAYYCPPSARGCENSSRTVFLDPYNTLVLPTTEGMQPASKAALLGHELGHAIGYGDVPIDGDAMENVNANENPVREALGEPSRTDYYVPEIIWVPGTR